MVNRVIKCDVCKKGIFYLPEGYKMDLKVTCVECQKGIKTKKTRQTASASYAKMKKGIRPDIHPVYSFRSATEANFARIMNKLGVEWKYEERVFTFDKVYKGKPFMYIMDFEIIKGCDTLPTGFYEIKGYMTTQSRQKLRRLKKCYPEEFSKTTVVVYNKYKKKDIEFCEKLGYNVMLYDQLTQEFSKEISEWE